MNLECDVRLEYVANSVSHHRWREGLGLAISKDDWNHNTLVLGEKGKKNTFALEKNIKKLHTSHLAEGLLTISLSTPMVNVYVRKAQVEALRNFVKLLAHVQKRPDDDLEEVAERMGMLVRKAPEAESESSDGEDDNASMAEEV